MKHYVRGNYFFYAFALGSLYPYFAPYFKETLSISNFELGLLLLVRPAMSLVSQLFWSRFIDSHGHRSRWAVILSVASAGLAPFILLGRSLSAIVVLFAIWSFFNAPLNTLMDAVAFDYLGTHRRMRLAFLRIFASMGWITATMSLGRLYDIAGLSCAFLVFPAGVLIAAWFVNRIPGDASNNQEKSHHSRLMRQLLVKPRILIFLMTVLIFETANNMGYQFLSVYGKFLGANNVQVGWIWAIGTIAETVTMLTFVKIVQKTGTKKILAIGMIMTVFRWVPMAFIHSWWQLLPFQMLHAFTFTFGYLGAAMFMDMESPSQIRFTAQAFYSLFVLNTGAIMGSFLGGVISDHRGYGASFALAGILTAVAAVMLMVFVKEPETH
ncbi:MFS transporter [bacterium]|nr:MFS transporter [bacterium]